MGQPSETVDEAAGSATLEDLRLTLAVPLARAAAFDGWTAQAVHAAASETGVDPDVAAYAFRGGAMDMIDAWIEHVDARLSESLPRQLLADLKIRDRIRKLVVFRLEALTGFEESLRRALSLMSMPQNLGRSLALGWRSADLMWWLAGDRATDYNYYTKRTILAGVYAATLSVFVDDDSEGKAETLAFLDRRIDGIMRFEKVKSRLLRPGEDRFSLARFLGRLRYPAR